jgi:proline iminopeptidase
MLHGGPGMADYLGPTARLVGAAASVIRFDQRACGRSAGGPPFDVGTAVADLDAVRAAWGAERWVVLGHSWGASLALAYAVAHPERTRGLVYVSGTGVDPAWHEAYRAARLARLSPDQRRRWDELRARRRGAGGGATAAAEAEYATLYAATDLGDATRARELVGWLHARGLPVNQEVNRVLGQDAARVLERPAFAARLRRLATPALVVHGALDPRPARYAAGVAELLPDAHLVLLPGVGHVPMFEDPEGFATTLRAFLTGLRP